jgi:hypothetical protein
VRLLAGNPVVEVTAAAGQERMHAAGAARSHLGSSRADGAMNLGIYYALPKLIRRAGCRAASSWSAAVIILDGGRRPDHAPARGSRAPAQPGREDAVLGSSTPGSWAVGEF